MYNCNDLIEDLKKSGINGLDTVMIHSSFSSIKNIEGGGEAVLKALKEYFKNGLLLMPAHTWDKMKKSGDVMVKTEANSCVGYLTNLAIKDPDFIRSNHPTHSVVAYGKNASEYIKDDDLATTPVPPNGSFGKLKYGGKILFIGCDLTKNTFIHSIEEEMGVPNRFTEEIFTFYTELEDGSKMEFHMPKHFNASCEHISQNYEKLSPILISQGALRRTRILDAPTYVLDAADAYQRVKNILAVDIHAFDDQRDIKEYL